MRLADFWPVILLFPAVTARPDSSIDLTLKTSNTIESRKDESNCCAVLQKALPNKIISPNQIFSFYSQQQTYWDNQEREVSPACFVLPTSAQEVSSVLTALVGQQCPFAIRSGGHSPIPGWSSIQRGVTLDLSNFSGIDVAADKSYVNIKPGNRWSSVYSQLDALGLGTSGGRVGTVGVGGLVTGGGISYFSKERGLVCDNVLEFETVLANGSIVMADANTNSDLYKALKGGTSNFGIVTNIKMKTFSFPGGNMWGGTVFHKTDDATRTKLFNYFSSQYATSSSDVHAHWIYSWSYVNAVATNIWASASNIQYTVPVTTTPDIFKPIVSSDVALISTAAPSTLTDQAQQMANLNPDGSRQLFATLTFRNNADFMEQFYQLSSKAAQSIGNTLGLQWTMSFQSLPHSVYSQGTKTGGNSLGLDDEKDDLIVALLTATWKLGLDDNAVYTAAQSFFTQAKAKSVEFGVDNDFLYLNYAAEFQDPIKSYGAASVAELQQVKAKYDPHGVFSTLVPGGFKIPPS
ncbi:uncharacterized protein PV09_02721 [Verruconis gallopava]|uniref:FAD-binding PCMH-type domain-containing protein n=1 Tax=Verruconis gallopava TaxID=253628 RepID=A0A0D2AH50_9PEZI|nr:uncharacterized protein PV09_02721 [Verruconis gallopava]KIW06248.1 hypothetical protein PV09_02721 [Verruconis gallopava]